MFTAIRWRLVRWNVAVFALILLLISVTVYIGALKRLPHEVDRELESRAATILSSSRLFESGDPSLGQNGYRGGFFYLAVASDGRILANPQQVTLPDHQVLITTEVRAPQHRTVLIDGEAVRLFIYPFPGPPREVARPRALQLPAALIVGQSLAPVDAALRRLLVGLIIGDSIGVLLVLAGAWFLAGRALVPIELAFRRQQEFVADASHELRTPLTVLRAATDLLDRHRDEPLAANGDLFDDLRAELARMERLAGDLLTLARSDLGEQTLAVAPLDLAALTADVVRLLAPLAREHDLALVSDGLAEPVPIEADPDRIQQVLLILLDNAIAYTPAGGTITVSAQRLHGEAVVSIADSGEGIAPEHLARIFSRFYRADPARSRERGGAGLGLPIARALIEQHQGQLQVQSAVGVGTTVMIRLPLTTHPSSLFGRLGQLAARATQRPAH